MSILTEKDIRNILETKLNNCKKVDFQERGELDALLNKTEFHDKLLHSLNLAIEGEESFFLTGKPGVGKSLFLKLFKRIIQTGRRYAILAPTGTAAINVQGQTIHSFFGFDFGIQGGESAYGLSDDTLAMLRQIDTIFIDEISMVRADILDGISMSLRYAKNNTKPFGGVQMIFVGDLFQIPPILQPEVLEALDHRKYLGGKPFHSKEYIKLDPERIIYDKVYRQDGLEFLEILDRVRTGNPTIEDLQVLNAKSYDPSDNKQIYLCTTKKTALSKNKNALAQLKGKSLVSRGDLIGKFSEGAFPTEATLELKEDSRVIMLVNNYEPENFFVNGDMGTIMSIETDRSGKGITGLYVLLDRTGEEIHVQRHTWENAEYVLETTKDDDGKVLSKELVRRIIGSYEQLPLALGWALTIHKAQGKTLEKVVLDFGRGCFAFGQAYVAMSRCISLENLYFAKPVRERDIFADPEVVDYLSGKVSVDIEKDSNELEVLFNGLKMAINYISKEERVKVINPCLDEDSTIFSLAEEMLKAMKFNAANAK